MSAGNKIWYRIDKMIQLTSIGRDVYEVAILGELLSRYNTMIFAKSHSKRDLNHKALVPIKSDDLILFMSKDKFKLTMKKMKADGIINYESGKFGYRVDVITEPIVSKITKKNFSVRDVIQASSLA